MQASLYALFDFELNSAKNLSIKEFVNLCYKLDAKIIQYRDKVNPLLKKQENLLILRELWDRTLLVNDEVKLSSLCDGVHLGQEDLSLIHPDKKEAVKILRENLKDKIIGLSTHNKKEIEEANQLDIDYIGLGAYRDTSTKRDIQGILGDDIKLLASYSKKDVAIIGGVKVSDEIDFAKYKVVGSDLYLCD